MIKLRWKNKWLKYEKVEWSGTANQCSRQVTFSIPTNPHDENFKNENIELGDLVYLYNGSVQLFVGTVTSRSPSSDAGQSEYVSMDFMHYLLKSSGTYKFKKTTPEKIVKKLCNELGIKTKNLAKTNANIAKLFLEEQCIYDIIIKAYRKANTGKKYMPVMEGAKISIIVKGESSGVTLKQGKDIIDIAYSDTTENMVNKVVIYNDKMKKLGEVQNKNNVEKYGVYQQTYTKEEGINAKTEANKLLCGVTKEASIESVGYIEAVAGKSIKIKDSSGNLTGTFYIACDTHVFENNTHTMTLDLAWKNTMEQGADTVNENSKNKKALVNSAKCYYLETSNFYHSSKTCSACKGKKTITSTVLKMKKILNTKGVNKGKRKYKACSKCWK